MTDFRVTELAPYPEGPVRQECVDTKLFRPFAAFVAPREGEDAIAWGLRQVTHREAPTSDGTWYRWCLVFVRSCYGIPPREPDAGLAWDTAERKHVTADPMAIPAGVPVFWELPSVADHIALTIGGGLCLSSDAKRRGEVDVVEIDSITRSWGGRLLGWSEDLNGVTVWTPPPPPSASKAERKKARQKLERVADWMAARNVPGSRLVRKAKTKTHRKATS